MTFDHAAKFAMPFGKHKGVPLEGVLYADPSYLSYMKKSVTLRPGPFKDAFDEFMANPDVLDRIEKAKLDATFARQNWER